MLKMSLTDAALEICFSALGVNSYMVSKFGYGKFS